jgi:predicted amidohydrolase
MKNEIHVALIQADLVWEDPEQNRANFSAKINTISECVDLIILPEMFTSGFTMNAKNVAEPMKGETLTWLKHIAKTKKCAIMGSLVIEENNKYYNRCVFVHPNGRVNCYDKRHTFTLAGEHKVYETGQEKVTIDYQGWKICPLVCYDLRFPVWARNVENYDLLIYVANWPKVRISAWDTLLKARAIENMSYCIGINRVGLDENNHDYPGHSACYDVLGNRLDKIPEKIEAIDIVTLSKAHIKAYRSKLNFLNDKDVFTILK